MTVEPWQLQTNSVLDVDGSKGYVLSNSGGIVTVQRESGKVEQYTTESVAENGKVHEDSPVQTEPAPQPSNVPPEQQQPTDQPSVATGANDPTTTGENRQGIFTVATGANDPTTTGENRQQTP